jgi:hypothetical protein
MDGVVPTGDSEDKEGNNTQRQVLQKYEGNVGDRDRSDGQWDDQRSMKIAT